jgi:hypothetical protein
MVVRSPTCICRILLADQNVYRGGQTRLKWGLSAFKYYEKTEDSSSLINYEF